MSDGTILPRRAVIAMAWAAALLSSAAAGGGEPPGAPPAEARGPQEEIPDWKARWELARVLGYLRRYRESETEYRKLLKEKRDLHDARVELAGILLFGGKKVEALALVEEIQVEKTSDASRIRLAEIFEIAGLFPRAEALYAAHLKRNPRDTKVRLKHAEVLSWLKRYPESIAEFVVVLEERPDDVQARRKYAYVLIWAEKLEEAAAELKKTLQREEER